MSLSKPAPGHGPPDEQKKLDDLLEAGKTVVEIAHSSANSISDLGATTTPL
jgi:hypothetical protein